MESYYVTFSYKVYVSVKLQNRLHFCLRYNTKNTCPIFSRNPTDGLNIHKYFFGSIFWIWQWQPKLAHSAHCAGANIISSNSVSSSCRCDDINPMIIMLTITLFLGAEKSAICGERICTAFEIFKLLQLVTMSSYICVIVL